MADPENKSTSDVPEWQKAQTPPEPTSETQQTPTENPEVFKLEQAKQFLKDPEVRKETTERKVEFLKSKGITQSDIDELLKDELLQVPPETQGPVCRPPGLIFGSMHFVASSLTRSRNQQRIHRLIPILRLS